MDNKINKVLWFEYHCFESMDSCDAELWLHSHQQVTVLSIVERGFGKTPKERGHNGEPRIYKIRFNDGFEYDAFEDELMRTPKEFVRPAPPTIACTQLCIDTL